MVENIVTFKDRDIILTVGLQVIDEQNKDRIQQQERLVYEDVKKIKNLQLSVEDNDNLTQSHIALRSKYKQIREAQNKIEQKRYMEQMIQ